MQFYTNFERDHELLVKAELEEYGYTDESSHTHFYRQFVLLDLRRRLVPIRKYSVHVSPELRANPLFQVLRPVIDEVRRRLQDGLSVRPYLSKVAKQVEKKDDLLVHWGINHLHLRPLTTVDASGYVERKSNDLLFFRVDGKDAYFIDILSHGTPSLWERDELVRIVDRRWPNLHSAFSRLKASPREQLSVDQIKRLRKCNTNFLVTTDTRSVWPATGTMASGHSLNGFFAAHQIAFELSLLATLIRLNYSKCFPASRNWVTVLSLVEVREDKFVVLDGASGRLESFERAP